MSGAERGSRPRARVIAAIALVATTAVTALVSWAVTQLATEATKRIGEGQPISVNVESDPGRTSVFNSDELEVVIPGERLVARDPGAGCRDLYAWGRSMGGIDAARTRLHLFTRGESPGEAVITRITALLERRFLSRISGDVEVAVD